MKLPLALVAGAALVCAGTTIAPAAQAATGCSVAYAVTSQWGGGFTANTTITNLGDAISSWTLTWTFTAGQSITQAWNGTATQTGTQATVTNAAYNGTIATSASTSFGFIGASATTNPAPTSFTLNGVTCTGTTTPTTPATTAPATTVPATSTAVPTTLPPTTAPPATAAPTTPAPTTPAPTTPVPTTPVPTASGPTTPPAAYPAPNAVSGDTGVHDPSVVKTPAGTYLLAATGNNLALKTSTDRKTWRNAGVVWPNGASWTTSYTGGSATLWAPDISYHNGQYYLYYAASSFGVSTSAIFLATSTTGAQGSWTNRGLVTSTNSSSNYNAIDPNLVVDTAGQWWLSFGSFWSGLKLIRLDPATGLPSTSDTAVRALATRPSSVSGAIEAPTIYRHGDYYYLFASFDFCCQGASSTYRVMVGRSSSITGPYVDRNGTAMTSGGGTEVLAGHGSIHGPGHQAVIDDNGTSMLFYHYYADSGASYLGINPIGWDAAGWPFVY